MVCEEDVRCSRAVSRKEGGVVWPYVYQTPAIDEPGQTFPHRVVLIVSKECVLCIKVAEYIDRFVLSDELKNVWVREIWTTRMLSLPKDPT